MSNLSIFREQITAGDNEIRDLPDFDCSELIPCSEDLSRIHGQRSQRLVL